MIRGNGDTDNVTKKALTGTARVKNVTILDQTWCDDRLKQLRLGLDRPDLDNGFVVFPKSDFAVIRGKAKFKTLQGVLCCSQSNLQDHILPKT